MMLACQLLWYIRPAEKRNQFHAFEELILNFINHSFRDLGTQTEGFFLFFLASFDSTDQFLLAEEL